MNIQRFQKRLTLLWVYLIERLKSTTRNRERYSL